MSKELTVEELREKADELIDAIEHGETVAILQNGKPIGTYSPFIVQRGTGFPFRNLKIAPLEKPLGVDAVEILIEERERERSGKKYGL
jgi:antitoxin (DNA-binding transcriptional repressor) of toxin-antitoxin stability system